MARSLPSADPNGLSDPYVEIYCGGSKAVSSVRPETLNPVWYENMKIKVTLPASKRANKVGPSKAMAKPRKTNMPNPMINNRLPNKPNSSP